MSGCDVLPLVEGGKGVAITTGECSGAWAAAGGIGTVSGVNADSYDSDGRIIPQTYSGRTRRERHEELVRFAIVAGSRDAVGIAGSGVVCDGPKPSDYPLFAYLHLLGHGHRTRCYGLPDVNKSQQAGALLLGSSGTVTCLSCSLCRATGQYVIGHECLAFLCEH